MSQQKQNLERFNKDDKSGYKNQKGEVIFQAEFKRQYCPSQIKGDYFWAGIEEYREWGLPNSNKLTNLFYSIKTDGSGRTCLTDVLYEAGHYPCEIYEISDGEGYYAFEDYPAAKFNGLINHNGEIIIEPIYQEILPFGNYFKVQSNGYWGLIDRNGNEYIEPVYDNIDNSRFYDVGYKGKQADLLDRFASDPILLENCDNIAEWNTEKKQLIVSLDGKEGIFDIIKNDFIIPAEFEELSFVNREIKGVETSDSFYIMGIRGDEIIIFDEAGLEQITYSGLMTGYENKQTANYITCNHKITIEKMGGIIKVEPIELMPKFYIPIDDFLGR